MEVIKPLESCRYYKGEEKCPFPLSSIEATYWGIEETWMKLVNPDEERRNRMVAEYSMDYPLDLKYVDAPISLRAVIYDQYCHYYGSKDGFENFIKTYIKRPLYSNSR
jgi:hypothetical protein